MTLLAANSLIAPTVGMVFWALVIFGLTWLFLGRFTFKPIAKALRERENTISDALAEAERAREEMARIRTENEAALKQQQAERTAMMREAKEAKDQIIREAREEAKVLSSRLLTEAQADIEAQKQAALLEVKNTAGQVAVEVAERILRRQLDDPSAQQQYAARLVEEMNLS